MIIKWNNQKKSLKINLLFLIAIFIFILMINSSESKVINGYINSSSQFPAIHNNGNKINLSGKSISNAILFQDEELVSSGFSQINHLVYHKDIISINSNNYEGEIIVNYVDNHIWNILKLTENPSIIIFNPNSILNNTLLTNFNLLFENRVLLNNISDVKIINNLPAIFFANYENSSSRLIVENSLPHIIFSIDNIIDEVINHSDFEFWSFRSYYYLSKEKLNEYSTFNSLSNYLIQTHKKINDYLFSNQIVGKSGIFPLLYEFYYLEEIELNQFDQFLAVIRPFVLLFEIYILIHIGNALQNEKLFFILYFKRGVIKRKLAQKIWMWHSIIPNISVLIIYFILLISGITSEFKFVILSSIILPWILLNFFISSYMSVSFFKERSRKFGDFQINRIFLFSIFSMVIILLFNQLIKNNSNSFFTITRLPTIYQDLASLIILILLFFYFKKLEENSNLSINKIGLYYVQKLFNRRKIYLLFIISFIAFATTFIVLFDIEQQVNQNQQEQVGRFGQFSVSFKDIDDNDLITKLENLKNHSEIKDVILIKNKIVEIHTDGIKYQSKVMIINKNEYIKYKNDDIDFSLTDGLWFPVPVYNSISRKDTIELNNYSKTISLDVNTFGMISGKTGLLNRITSNYIITTDYFWSNLGFNTHSNIDSVDLILNFKKDLDIQDVNLFLSDYLNQLSLSYDIEENNLNQFVVNNEYHQFIILITILSIIIVIISLKSYFFDEIHFMNELKILIIKYYIVNKVKKILITINLFIIFAIILAVFIGSLIGYIILNPSGQFFVEQRLKLPSYYNKKYILEVFSGFITIIVIFHVIFYKNKIDHLTKLINL